MVKPVLISQVILAIHVVIIIFTASGLLVIPVGARLRWRLVRIAWLRILHLSVLATIVAQALAGRACILTIWQHDLTGGMGTAEPMIMRWVDNLIYWHLPVWFFAATYTAAFLYVASLTILVPFWGDLRFPTEEAQQDRSRLQP